MDLGSSPPDLLMAYRLDAHRQVCSIAYWRSFMFGSQAKSPLTISFFCC